MSENFSSLSLTLKTNKLWQQGDQKIRKKRLPNFSKNSPKSCQVKKGQKYLQQSSKHLQQTTFETLKVAQ
jgi:hypothetical protein